MGGSIRRRIQWLAFGAASVVATIIIVPLAGEFFVELAREREFYAQPSAKVAAVMDIITAPLEYRWFWGVAGLVFGFAIGVWTDVLLRREDRMATQERASSAGQVQPARDEAADLRLAEQCEELGGELMEAHAAMERLRSDHFWMQTNADHEAQPEVSKETRNEQNREEERFRRRFAPRFAQTITELRRRKVNIDPFGIRLTHYDYNLLAFLMFEIASALRNGDYRNRQFYVDISRFPKL